MSNMNFNCDVCGREVLGCTFVNGMKFCAKCYQETFGETDKDRKLAELEAKLAESEKQCRECKHLNKKIELNIKNKLMAENCELQKQLAEKDEEIEQWKSMAERSSNILDRFNYCGESIIYNTTREQDKISFAVEQLRQVQKYIITDEKDMFGMPYLMKSSYIYDYIDNQIKQLTHQHEDKGE